MYQLFRDQCEKLLRIPPEPEPPPGDESSTRSFRAAPNFYRYLVAIWAAQTVPLIIGAIFIAVFLTVAAFKLRDGGMRAASLILVLPVLELIVAFVGSLFRLAMVRLDFDKRWYLVTDRSLRIREGVLTVREMTVTFANIQNISISQGPIQRALGISDLVVETAGGGASGGHDHHGQTGPNLHKATFRGIDNAAAVRELIELRLKKLKDSGLGDHDDPPATDAPQSAVMLLQEIHAEAAKLRQAVATI